jgi:hypothetical protein
VLDTDDDVDAVVVFIAETFVCNVPRDVCIVATPLLTLVIVPEIVPRDVCIVATDPCNELTELAVLVTVEFIELRDAFTDPRFVFMVTTVPFTLASVALSALNDTIIVPASVLSVITPLFTLTRVAFIALSVV